ncbi:hypothetical protein XMV201_002926 [Aliiroseovarius sp. xm-v-201]|uniref:AAA family ATPase n=1 Tax=unclassified Aliiroseovarius TaxID=2623558 RepID=UPI001567FAB9|nr:MULTISPECIES: helicase RepA family protein [unclassified Aliiroseovarius]NRP51146.1 hypothetical protein [Aliiroseovarius sp. xm-m-354]NRQ05898.1 hypothetical protein [Aliiroseovarius sp. xm-m-309]NRQ09102.1 hypothetical protein [Aliiroseovarius sp. xm-v-201]
MQIDAKKGYDAFYELAKIVETGEVAPKVSRQNKSSFPLVPIGTLELTEPEFLIDGLIETETLSLIFGDPGCGKTFLALDLAACVASGRDFHGREVMQGPVVYMAGEGHNGIIRRFMAWAKENDIEDPGSLPFFKSERAANFLDGATMKVVADACDAIAGQHGEPRLIVVDTVARSFGIGDENSTQDMGQFICAVDDLKARYPGATILLVHHTGHGDKSRARGAMALKGALDAEYRVEKSSNIVTMTATKMKDAPEPPEIAFELRDVSLGVDRKGNPFGSAILSQTDAPAKAAKKLTSAQKLAIETYKIAARDKGVRDEGAFFGVHLEDWREVFYQKHTGDTTEAKKKAFQRQRENSFLFDVNDDLYLLKGHGVEDLM